jgi:hypothetical protein
MMLVLILAIGMTSFVEASHGWSPTAWMSTPRMGHTATLLADGRVLVCGGDGGTDASVATTEVYDPTLATWSPTASMRMPRYWQTATLLVDGRVLVSGGIYTGPAGGAPLDSAELYDPRLNTWSLTASMTKPRYLHTATLLSDGRVLVIGDGAEIYDPRAGTWTATAPLSIPRSEHTATLLSDGRVLVSGSFGGSTSVSASAELYDPRLDTWSPTAPMDTPRYRHAATRLRDGRVLVSGGYGNAYIVASTAELYDPSLGTWSPAAAMTTPRYMHHATLLSDGRVLASGGIGMDYLASAELYDPSQDTWSVTASMNMPRYWGTATLVPDGRVLVSGGFYGDPPPNDYPYLAAAEIYSPPTAGEDTTRPQVSCDAADGAWHSSDAAIACTASDAGSGLGNAADARFTLTTHVPVGTETADATTDSRRVCDNAGNCATAGPITANKVDKKSPTVLCGASDGAWHNSNVVISCTASDLGSRLKTAADGSFTLTTTVPAGTERVSASTNTHRVCDGAGSCTSAGPIAGNRVDRKAPTITIASPIAGATYAVNTKVTASYSCSDGGSGMRSCAGPVANGSPFTTSSIGTRTFAVTATDRVGNLFKRTVTYTVVSRKTALGGQPSSDARAHAARQPATPVQ